MILTHWDHFLLPYICGFAVSRLCLQCDSPEKQLLVCQTPAIMGPPATFLLCLQRWPLGHKPVLIQAVDAVTHDSLVVACLLKLPRAYISSKTCSLMVFHTSITTREKVPGR